MVFHKALPLVCAVLLLLVVGGAPLTGFAAGFTDYDITLQELNKVKKVNPKKEKKSHKKQKREKKEPLPATTTEPAPGVPSVPASPETSPAGPAAVPLKEAVSKDVPVTKTAPEDTSGITHDPFSFIVTGKRTVLQAVVDGTGDMAALFCRFSSAKGDVWARVPMKQVVNTHFTYQAILPALASETRTLRYSFVKVDSNGKETHSREYAISVKPSFIVPGWQQDPANDKLEVTVEKNSGPMTGFSDPGYPPAAP